MAIISKAKAIQQIQKTKRKNKKGETKFLYCAYLGTDACGKKLRFARSNKEELIDFIEDFYDEFYAHGNLQSNSYDRHLYFEAVKATNLLKKYDIKLSLLDVVREYIDANGGVTKKTVYDAFNEYIKTFDPLQDIYIKTINARVKPWVTWIGDEAMVHQLTPNDLTIYIEEHPNWGKITRNNTISDIKTFIQWCVHPLRMYAEKNPFNIIQKEKIPYQEPKFLSIAEVKKLFSYLFKESSDIEMILFLTLWFFCGIRVIELERMEIQDINLEDKTIRIKQPKGWTRGQPPRLVAIQDNALKILDFYQSFFKNRRKCFRNSENIKARINTVCNSLGINFPKNAGRHSFITYHVACYKNPTLTEMLCGTSSQMRIHHYQGLASSKDGEEYFKITI